MHLLCIFEPQILHSQVGAFIESHSLYMQQIISRKIKLNQNVNEYRKLETEHGQFYAAKKINLQLEHLCMAVKQKKK